MTDDEQARRDALHMVLAMYANEPCRICGVLLTMDDLHEAVWTGYSTDNKARLAHKECWDKHTPSGEWAHAWPRPRGATGGEDDPKIAEPLYHLPLSWRPSLVCGAACGMGGVVMTETYAGHTAEALRALCAGATPGPWRALQHNRQTHAYVLKSGGIEGLFIDVGSGLKAMYTDPRQCKADAEFIAAAREALPAALDRVAALEAQLKDAQRESAEWEALDHEAAEGARDVMAELAALEAENARLRASTRQSIDVLLRYEWDDACVCDSDNSTCSVCARQAALEAARAALGEASHE